jgi:dipicolinate synthase subunit B
MNIGFGITGSFCTHKQILEEIKSLIKKGHNIIPIITEVVSKTDTRFGSAKEFIKSLEMVTGNKVVDNIVKAEPLGPKGVIDLIVVAPCTGNTLAKLANAISDNAVTMTAKSLMRNNKPVVIGVSSNDALGQNMQNLAKLMSSKNFYFVPIFQDDPQNKPKSLIAKWSLIEDTILQAKEGKQIQPVLISNNR